MKRRLCFLLLPFVILFSSCSVQENMSPAIFLNRLSKQTDVFDFENSEQFIDDNKYICFVNDNTGKEHVFELSLTETGDINKISLACIKTDKAENFISYIRQIIFVYAPEENENEIINSITENGKITDKIKYYETQWHSWCSYADKNGFYFSVTNKKLVEQTTVEFSLKPNDKIDF